MDVYGYVYEHVHGYGYEEDQPFWSPAGVWRLPMAIPSLNPS